MAKSGILDPGSCSNFYFIFFQTHFFCGFLKKIEPGKGGHFQNTNMLRVFEK